MRDMTDIIPDVIQSKINKIFTAIPGEFIIYDGKLAKVKPLIQKLYVDDLTGVPVPLPLPIVVDVPVMFPATKNFQMTFPIEKGDGCLLIFSMRDISNWIKTGVDSPPANKEKYALNDAIAIPGLISPILSTVIYDPANFVLKYKTTEIKINEALTTYVDIAGNNISIDATGVNINSPNLQVLL